MTTDPQPHGYLSTACYHALHGRCREQCKFCEVKCSCACHEVAQAPQPVPVAYREQWPQWFLERMFPDIRERLNLLTSVIHARDYLVNCEGGLWRLNAIEILTDGISNVLDHQATGLEWWTLRHRLSETEIQSGSWLDKCKTSWITARQAEEKRHGKQR